MKKREIHILGYPTNKASTGGASANTPLAYEKIVHPHIAGKYGVSKRFSMVQVFNQDTPEKNGINNFKSVYRSVEKLFIAQCEVLWNDCVPMTIGGDHSQGLPTVKSGLFVEVLKHFISGASKIFGQEQKHQLKKLADEGHFIKAAEILDSFAQVNKKILAEIKQVLNNIHVIWIDAHGDFNTKQISDSGNFHGMSLAAACGLDAGGFENIGGMHIIANPENVHLICARDLDEKEEALLKKYNVDFERFEMSDSKLGKIRAKGQPVTKDSKEFSVVFANLLKEIKNRGGKIILSMDIDHLPFPETGTPLGSAENVRKNRYDESPSGPPPAWTYSAYSNIAHDEDFISFDITEIALSYTSSKTGRKIVGAQAFRGGVNIIASMLGGDEARLKLFKALKKEGNLVRRFKELNLV